MNAVTLTSGYGKEMASFTPSCHTPTCHFLLAIWRRATLVWPAIFVIQISSRLRYWYMRLLSEQSAIEFLDGLRLQACKQSALLEL